MGRDRTKSTEGTLIGTSNLAPRRDSRPWGWYQLYSEKCVCVMIGTQRLRWMGQGPVLCPSQENHESPMPMYRELQENFKQGQRVRLAGL